MKYYVYFDAYGHAGQIISEQQMAKTFHADPDEFLKAMCQTQPGGAEGHTTGHVGTLRFDTEKDLRDYLEGLGEEITGFYGCRSESRPYNF
jgi:hypothetical protein